MRSGRRRKLKLPKPPEAERRLPIARIAAGLAVLVALGGVVLELGSRLFADEGPAEELVAEVAAPVEVPMLRLRGLDPVRARVEIDGELVFSGTLQGGADLSWPAGRLAAVELDDLTRAEVHYDGERIEPLGSLSTPRRLEFVDDL